MYLSEVCALLSTRIGLQFNLEMLYDIIFNTRVAVSASLQLICKSKILSPESYDWRLTV